MIARCILKLYWSAGTSISSCVAPSSVGVGVIMVARHCGSSPGIPPNQWGSHVHICASYLGIQEMLIFAGR